MLSSVLFLLYKILFSEIVGAVFFTILAYIGSLRFRRTQTIAEYHAPSHGHDDHGDDLFEPIEEHHDSGHDPHGGHH